MDRYQFLLLALPIFLFCSDILNLFTPPKPTTNHDTIHYPPSQYQPKTQQLPQQPLEFPTQKTNGIGGIGIGIGIGIGSTININFCTSCSYRGNAVTVKNMLEIAFPGINIILENYPPALPKRLLSKVVPVVQAGIIGIIVAGEQIFPRLGIMTPPPWYYSLRANKFGSIASTWLFGNFIQSFLQSSAAFEVYCNGELVFSKLKEHRFPGEIELRDLVGQKLAKSRFADGLGGGLWS